MPQLMLEGKVDDRDLIISGLRTRVSQLEEELRSERVRSAQVSSGAQSLRKVLSPLYGALQAVFGEISEMGVAEEHTTSSSPRLEAVWNSWKDKLGGQPAKAIDALLKIGPMNQTQLRIQIGCANGSIAGIVYQLNKAGLINKNGGKISLKEL